MSFLAPFAILSVAIIGPIIVAMYLLKLRRNDHVVSSTFLWRSMVRDVEANAPWQKLRPNILLLLQLLLLLLLALALARPFFATHGIAGQNLIIIIDRSASMGATDGDPTRLDSAKATAIQLVDQLPDEGRATIIASGGTMELPASATKDRRELHRAIDAITLHHGGGSDMSQALVLAAALAARTDQSEVALISDGNITIPDNLTMPARVRYFPIGRSADNVAMNALALQRNASGQVLFAQAINYAPDEATRRMDIYLDGTLFSAYHMTLPPNEEQSMVVDVPADVTVAEARLYAPDSLPTDDHAWAVSSTTDNTTVRVVSAGNYFLQTALGLLPGIRVQQEDVAWSAEKQTDATTHIPLTIFDGVVPATLPAGNIMFIAPPRSTSFFSVTGEIEFPPVRPVPGDEPLLRNVSLSDVSVMKAVRLVPGNWARVVVDSDGTPLLLAGERDGRRIVVLAFDLHLSDLPLQVPFPLLLSNIISYLVPGSGAEATHVSPGQPIAFRIEPSVSEVRVTRPDDTIVSSVGGLFGSGSSDTVRIQHEQVVYADTDMPGVYRIELFNGNNLVARQRYAVNLFSPTESQIAPRDDVPIPQTSGLQSAVTGGREGKQEMWRWFAAAVLLLLLVEWAVYHKGAFALLRERWSQRT